MVAGRAGGGGGGGGGGSEFNTYLFTAGPTQIHAPQPFSLHCNKKFIHAAGDHHGSRQNIRPYRTISHVPDGKDTKRGSFFCTLFNTASSAPPPHRLHCVGGCWDRSNRGQLRLQHWLSDVLTTRLDLIHNSARSHLCG
jgi:hypothetical protein